MLTGSRTTIAFRTCETADPLLLGYASGTRVDDTLASIESRELGYVRKNPFDRDPGNRAIRRKAERNDLGREREQRGGDPGRWQRREADRATRCSLFHGATHR